MVTIHMAASLDGFIAKKDGSVSWLQSTDSYENGITLTDDYITEFVSAIDCYVMGSKTYESALRLGWPYGDTPVIVATTRSFASTRASVEFYNLELDELLNNIIIPRHNNIWVVGGSEVVKDVIQKKLADTVIISIMPVLLGDGTLFFDYIGHEQKLHLKDVASYKDGMVELTYEFIR